MSKVLQHLLANEEPLFPLVLNKLEQSTGNSGVDTRLIADITHKAHEVMRSLALDPADSTAREVYLALNSYVKKDTGAFALLLDCDFVLWKFDGEVVSFNLVDIIENAHHELLFEQRLTSHGRRALRGEIVARYVDHPRTDESVTQQLVKDAKILLEADSHHTKAVEQYKNQKGDTNVASPYILAIGDIFSDAFIKLNEEVARVETDEKGEKRISLPLGSKPPYDGVDIVKGVGPGPNAAVSIARLGLHAGLNSFLGNDQVGTEAIEYLQQEGVSTDTMTVQDGVKTSYYYVLRYGAERTILVKNESFDYVWQAPAEEPEWVYLALMSDASWQFHEDLLAYLEEHPNVKLAFQPGTFHFKWGVEKLAGLYRRSHILVLNREEAVDITGRSYDSIRELANGLHDLGPQKVVITDGPNGSYASYDFKLVTIPNYPDPGPPVDRTGAGDAFASTIVAALALGETMDVALTWAPINSMNVVQHIGAQAGLLRRAEIEKYLAEAPEWYKVTDFEG